MADPICEETLVEVLGEIAPGVSINDFFSKPDGNRSTFDIVFEGEPQKAEALYMACLLYTSPSPRDRG